MKHYFKIIVIFLSRILLRIFYIFPIKKNRILFSSFEGRNYGCNPKYIFEYMYDRYGDLYEYIWCLDNESKILEKYNVLLCVPLSIKHLFYLSTSHVIISNQPILPVFPKRKQQMFINTTHGGGAYKKGGINATFVTTADKRCMIYMKNLRAKMIDYVISSCRVYTEVFSTETEYNIDKKKFLPIGMPRNDLFFNPNQDKKREIRNKLGIDEDLYVILYAPTYRGSYRNTSLFQANIDVNTVCQVVEQRFGKKSIFLYRSHIADRDLCPDTAMDVSDYQDMQELLLITDIFITDYSSSIWDFSQTRKPGFLFTPDLSNYLAEVNFHTPIEDWPYPFALTMDELCKDIIDYNEAEAHIKIQKHHDLLGSYEKGNATTEVCKIIKKHLDLNI